MIYTILGILILVAVVAIIKLFITGHIGLGIVWILLLALEIYGAVVVNEILAIILLVASSFLAFKI